MASECASCPALAHRTMDWELVNKLLLIVVQSLTEVLTPVLVVLAGVLALKLKAWLEAKVGAENFKLIEALASAAVKYAEQVNLNKDLDTRKRDAIYFLQTELERRKIKLDLVAIDKVIEAAVMDNFNMAKAEAAQPLLLLPQTE